MKRSNGHVSDARIAMTAVNPAPMLAERAGEMLIGKTIDDALAEAAADAAARTAKPLTTSALTPEYRREKIWGFPQTTGLAAPGELTFKQRAPAKVTRPTSPPSPLPTPPPDTLKPPTSARC